MIMNGLLKLIPLDAARRALGASGPAAKDPSGTVRQGPKVPGKTDAMTRALAIYAPGSTSPRWRLPLCGGYVTDAHVADWPVVPPREESTTDQSERRSR